VWTDLDPINSAAAERLGYPTQKPLALVERIIEASTNEGDLVLDPFCGCGTTIAAASRLKRKWIGIDLTALAISLIKSRLTATGTTDYKVLGEPTTSDDAAIMLATRRPEEVEVSMTTKPSGRLDAFAREADPELRRDSRAGVHDCRGAALAAAS